MVFGSSLISSTKKTKEKISNLFGPTLTFSGSAHIYSVHLVNVFEYKIHGTYKMMVMVRLWLGLGLCLDELKHIYIESSY